MYLLPLVRNNIIIMTRSLLQKFGTSFLAVVLVVTITTATTPYTRAAGGNATLGMQITQQAELAVSAVQNTLTAANTGITAVSTAGLLNKELLDGIGWAIAKQIMSQMTQSLVNWINSGFQGSPAFITDLNGFLLDALDTAAGEYIRSLGELVNLFVHHSDLMSRPLWQLTTSRRGAACRLDQQHRLVDFPIFKTISRVS